MTLFDSKIEQFCPSALRKGTRTGKSRYRYPLILNLDTRRYVVSFTPPRPLTSGRNKPFEGAGRGGSQSRSRWCGWKKIFRICLKSIHDFSVLHPAAQSLRRMSYPESSHSTAGQLCVVLCLFPWDNIPGELEWPPSFHFILLSPHIRQQTTKYPVRTFLAAHRLLTTAICLWNMFLVRASCQWRAQRRSFLIITATRSERHGILGDVGLKRWYFFIKAITSLQLILNKIQLRIQHV